MSTWKAFLFCGSAALLLAGCPKPGGSQQPGLDRACGGLTGCPSGQYCSFKEGGCGARGAKGVCKPKPEMCTMNYQPVCGCDGKTYGNACAAGQNGVSVAYRRACIPPNAKLCGGLAGLVCPTGQICIEDPRNTACRNGATDCLGVCVPKPFSY